MREAHLHTFHWGWLSSGCYTQLRYEQGRGYLSYLKTLPVDFFGRISFSHPGWLFDHAAPPEVHRVPGQELEPTRSVGPFTAEEVAEWRKAVAEGRLEPVTYYYVPLVAEQVTGETLIRAIRFTRAVFERELGVSPIALTSHDPFALMNWGTAQQVQLAALTGHRVLMGGLEGRVVGMDDTSLPCIGGTLQRYGLETMSSPMIDALDANGSAAFIFATEMHWHHRTFPFERALRQVAIRFRDVRFIPCGVAEWIEKVEDWPEVPAAGLGSKGWNGGGPDQMMLSRLLRSCERLLPGIEALAALDPGSSLTEHLETLWKRVLFLNDNHIRWFVHDHKRIFLPAAAALLADVEAAARDTLQAQSVPLQATSPRLVVWNLLGRARTAIASAEVDLPAGSRGVSLRSAGDERIPIQVIPLEAEPEGDLRRAKISWVAHDVPAWGYKCYDLDTASDTEAEAATTAAAPLILENARLKATFAAHGELVSLEDKRNGKVLRGGNRLLNLIPQPYHEAYVVKGGVPLRDQGGDDRGCFSASAELVLPEVATYEMHLDEMHGCLLMVEVDVLDRSGNCLAPTQRFPIVNLHWMGPLHHHTAARTIPLGELASGSRLRITLWFLSEGSSVVGAGGVDSPRTHLAIDSWNVRWAYRLAVVPGESTTAEILEQGPVRQRLRFRGRLPQCSYETIATLAGPKSQSRIDFETQFTFSTPMPLGLPTPPLPQEVGSYLGSNNECPYIPGLVVTFPVPEDPDLIVDAPYAVRDPMRPVHPTIVGRSWLADATEPVDNFWWGLSPFTALSCVAVRDAFGLIADGSPHFLLWRGLEGDSDTVLGTSFGASVIHPRTVTKRILPDSEWFALGRGPAYTDFQDGAADYEINHPVGSYLFRYSLSLETDPVRLVQESLDRAVPLSVVVLPAGKSTSALALSASGLSVESSNLYLSGCEHLVSEPGGDVVRVRLAEMGGKPTTTVLVSRRVVEKVEAGLLPVQFEQVEPNRVKITMPAYAVRELILTLSA
jgi:hypothetical protein